MNKKNTIFMLRTMALIAVIISIVTFAPLNILIAWLTPLPTTVQAEVEKALTHGFDGIIVYVDAAGKPPAYFSAGWHNREQKIPAYPSALFKIASIEKLYDAVAITKLVAQNQLSLDNTLIDYFPELEERIAYANAITVKMLVQHRSGIPNFTDTSGFWDTPQLASDETALELIFDLPANFEPDTAFEYSNTNYLLLTKLIEKVTASSKYDYIHQHVLQPLSLNNTFGSMQDVDRTRLMSGYYVGVEQDIKNINYGSMLATAQDVGVFLRALNDGSVFNAGEQQIYSSIYVFEHTGLIPGYQSIARYHADIDTVVVQFINTANFADYTHWELSEIVYNRIVEIIRREKIGA